MLTNIESSQNYLITTLDYLIGLSFLGGAGPILGSVFRPEAQRGAPLSREGIMTINGTTIFAERTTALLNPRHESALAAFWKGRAATASLTLDCICETITAWVADGGAIATARGELIDVERAEQSGSQFLHLETGALVDLGDGELLRSLETAFGADPKRTMNRLLSKAERPTTRRTDRRLLSALFWMNVARGIVQFREDRAKAA